MNDEPWKVTINFESTNSEYLKIWILATQIGVWVLLMCLINFWSLLDVVIMWLELIMCSLCLLNIPNFKKIIRLKRHSTLNYCKPWINKWPNDNMYKVWIMVKSGQRALNNMCSFMEIATQDCRLRHHLCNC